MALRWSQLRRVLGRAPPRIRLQQANDPPLSSSCRPLLQALQWRRSFADLPPPPSPPVSVRNPSADASKSKEPGAAAGRSAAAAPSFSSSLDEVEIAKFASIAETWWDSEGPFKPLHLMNPTRVSFIRSTLCRHFGRDLHSARPLDGLKIVDVGCGGGILAEPLARMGATVTGIDAVEKNIKIAGLHAGLDPQTSMIEYQCATAEKMVEEGRKFDAVISLEVIEHVADPAGFCKSLAALAVLDGAIVISTINRSIRAYATAIVAAEYLLNWLPRGTHQWTSLVTPEELVLMLQRASVSVQEMAGFVYHPLTGEWALSDDINVNFIAYGAKSNDQASVPSRQTSLM